MADPDIADTERRAPAAPARTDSLASLKEGLKTIIGAVLIALVLRSFGYEPFNIPSESMLPRLLTGDYLFVSKWPYGYSRHSFPLSAVPIDGRIGGSPPERGDIVVFKNPRDNRTDFIKRVIGLPGDIVQMREGHLFLNGQQIPKVRIADFTVPISPNTDCGYGRETVSPEGDPICVYAQYRETLPGGVSYAVLDTVEDSYGDTTAPFVVPEDHFFMMGDNRDNSEDSRFGAALGGIGYVPAENLVGRASFMFFSTDGSANWLLPWTWATAARWDRIGRSF